MTDSDAPTPREALEPFRSAAESEASRPWVEDGYFTGPGGLTVGDWRRLRAALASPVERHVDLATIRSALADAIGKTDTLDDLAAFLVDRLQAAASTAAAGEGADTHDDEHHRYVIETTCPNCGHVWRAETSVRALGSARDWAYRRSSEGVLPADAAAGEGALTAASEKLLRDFDRTPDAIDYSELSARLWLIEREAALPRAISEAAGE